MTMVTKPPGSRRERNKAALRGRILAAALRLFERRGFEAVTVDQIAHAADVGKGTVYNHFASKEEIVVAFMVDVEHAVQAALPRLLARRRTAATVLADYVRLQFAQKERHHAFVRVLLGQMLARATQFLPHMQAMQRVINPPLERMFEQLRARGAISSREPLARLVLAFKTIHLGLSALWAIEGPPFRSTYELVDLSMRLFGRSLAAPES